MRKLIFPILCLFLLLPMAVACGEVPGPDDGENPRRDIVLSTKQTGYVDAGNDFAFNFLSGIDRIEKKDYLISPLSMQFLLGMLLNGARGETAAEICKVLGYGAGETPAVNEFCRLMLDELPTLDRHTKLSLADAVFVNKLATPNPDFKKSVARWYDATVEQLDFSNASQTLETINGWGSRQTNGLIPQILEEVDNGMIAYLLNALYFKGIWTHSFSSSQTAEHPFLLESGGRRPVKMMQQRTKFLYGENDLFQIVRLPYGNQAYAMYVLLPREKKVGEVVASLSSESWRQTCAGMVETEVDLWLPRFETKYRKELNDLLIELGMRHAFSPVLADFTAMLQPSGYLDFVLQEAVIKVDEEGTEAAAISIAGIRKEASPDPQTAVFHADHPFLYLICESSTGTILFAGKYAGGE